jgi:dolichol-phosphate mannosyltransferase
MTDSVEVSIIVPVFNEEAAIASFLDRVILAASFAKDFEVIIINDGSTDLSERIIRDYAQRFPEISLINLSKNSGHMAALTAGFEHSRGDWILSIDGDGQDPPELLSEMISLCKVNNAEICFMVRRNRDNDSLRHRLFSPLYYQLLRRATQGSAPLQAADFRLMSRAVVDSLNGLPERNRIYRVLSASLGFKTIEMEYERSSREAGKSKYHFFKLASLGLRSLLATTGAPLRWLSQISLFIAVISLAFSGFVFIRGLLGTNVPGWASVALLISVMMFFQSLSLAIISEFLLTILADIRKRPLYQIAGDHNES